MKKLFMHVNFQLIKLKYNISDVYFDKCMKIKSNLDDYLPLLKTLNKYNVLILIISDFYDNNKQYPQVFLAKCLYKLEK